MRLGRQYFIDPASAHLLSTIEATRGLVTARDAVLGASGGQRE